MFHIRRLTPTACRRLPHYMRSISSPRLATTSLIPRIQPPTYTYRSLLSSHFYSSIHGNDSAASPTSADQKLNHAAKLNPVAVPEVNPVADPEVNPAAVPEVNPAAVPEVNPAAVPEVNPVADPTVADPKVNTIVDSKLDPAVDSKLDAAVDSSPLDASVDSSPDLPKSEIPSLFSKENLLNYLFIALLPIAGAIVGKMSNIAAEQVANIAKSWLLKKPDYALNAKKTEVQKETADLLKSSLQYSDFLTISRILMIQSHLNMEISELVQYILKNSKDKVLPISDKIEMIAIVSGELSHFCWSILYGTDVIYQSVKSFKYSLSLPELEELFFNDNRFHCHICGESFVSPTALAKHCSEKHGECTIQCRECGAVFRDSEEYFYHKKRTDTLVCPVLPYESESDWKIRHLLEKDWSRFVPHVVKVHFK